MEKIMAMTNSQSIYTYLLNEKPQSMVELFYLSGFSVQIHFFCSSMKEKEVRALLKKVERKLISETRITTSARDNGSMAFDIIWDF